MGLLKKNSSDSLLLPHIAMNRFAVSRERMVKGNGFPGEGGGRILKEF
jgi:hypothetical protein